MKKIALAHDHLFQNGGAERILATLANIYQQAPIFTLINDKKVSSALFAQDRVRTSILQKLPARNKIFPYFLPLMSKIWKNTDLSEYDLVISSSSAFVKGVKVGENTKHICYCHAPTRYLWDDKDEYLGNLEVNFLSRLVLKKLLPILKKWDFEQAQNVHYFLANSKFIAEKIAKHYHKKAQVIYPPIKVDDFQIADPADKIEDYYLIVSRLRPYKKVDLAIEAFNNLRLPLKIIGSGSEYPRLKKMASDNIEFLGELSDKERNHYLSHCKAFIYPQVEDFGISALEAMASGRPVVAYGKGGVLETIIDQKTGLFFHEQNWAALAHTILRFQEMQFDPYFIREHVRQFDQELFVKNLNFFISSI
ncbi:glycosyltransferase [Patescibacteria group bacterium]|nr:glycosyltransferase [Patescibacteria group bacterium]